MATLILLMFSHVLVYLVELDFPEIVELQISVIISEFTATQLMIIFRALSNRYTPQEAKN
jgi:hypothetical protein